MICCVNPSCHNPPVPDGTKFCSNCGVPLVILRNRYRPIKSLGGGGFAKTYLAEDTDKLNEKCVIKQFAPQFQGTAGLNKATELFEQEARRLQQLGEHPQIPALLAYFQEDTHLYLLQQFIDGRNLLQELEQQGAFSEGKIKDLLHDLLNILQVVHWQQVIHRDIKPENMILRSDRKVVLIDFGASKQMTKTVVTGQGTMIGSFGYAPLEQMQGGEAYPASDLYSLGATCFHLLSGINPWELWKSQGYGWVRNWRQHLQQPVSIRLGQIIDKLLQEDYRQRYQSATEVLQDLTLLETPPIAPTQPIIPPEITTQSLQNTSVSARTKNFPIPIVFLVLPLLLLIGGGAAYFVQLKQTTNTDNTETDKTEQKSDQTDKTSETEQDSDQTNKTSETETKSAVTYNDDGIKKYNNKDFRGAIEDYTQAIKINPNYAEAYYNRGIVYDELGDKKTAIQDYNQAIKIKPNDADAYYNRGIAQSDLGDKKSAIEDYSQAIRVNSNYANAYYNRGIAQSDLGDKKAAIQDYTQAIRIDPKYTNAYYNRGIAQSDLGNRKAAIEDYSQAIKINPKYANAYINRGLVQSELGDNKAAFDDYTQAIKITPNDAIAYYNRGIAQSSLGNKKAAIEDYNQALKIDPKYTNAYYNRGIAQSSLGNKKAAVEDYSQAIKLDSNYANAYYNRGIAYGDLLDKKTAISDFQQAANLYKQQGRESDYKDALNRIEKLEK